MSNKSILLEEEKNCRPLDTFGEISLFIEDPPAWRSLCTELKPHSKYLIRNIEVNKNMGIDLEIPHTFCHSSDEEDVQRHEGNKLPKTLVCHDMANGYHDDRSKSKYLNPKLDASLFEGVTSIGNQHVDKSKVSISVLSYHFRQNHLWGKKWQETHSIIDGTGNHDAYAFYNWAGVDIFCYFSHHLITIPPLGWINVGHEHGVKVIGTVITEWAEGVIFWESILASEMDMQYFASTLVAIAKSLKFDGWLLNIENKITEPEMLLKFVQYLHTALHKELTNAVLIWYDSVTIEGHLNWQNGLSGKNKAFFDACDGIFTNYSWSESDVAASAELAGDRLTDLYIGIDVWGRNFHGGGKFNTQRAVEVAYRHGCSIAIFAPAWTHEAMSEANDKDDPNAIMNSNKLDKYERFVLRDRALWDSLWPFLNTRVPSEMPFQTSFCRGQGKKRRLYGEALCPVPWYNLRHMQYQPNAAHGPHAYLLTTAQEISKSLCASSQHVEISKSQESLYNVQSTEKTEERSTNLDKGEMDIGSKVNNLQALRVKEKDSATEQKSFKRRITSVLKHIFKTKNKKTELLTDENLNTSTSSCKQMSMAQVSVTVNLNQAQNKVRYALTFVPEELECLQVFLEDSFIGGSCLKINPTDIITTESRFIRLFYCDFYVEDTLIACVVIKNLKGFETQGLNLKLFANDSEGKDLRIVMVGRNLQQAQSTHSLVSKNRNEYPLALEKPEFKHLQAYILMNEPGFYVPTENAYGWIVRYYEIKMPGTRIKSINLRTSEQEGPILLGYLGLSSKRR